MTYRVDSRLDDREMDGLSPSGVGSSKDRVSDDIGVTDPLLTYLFRHLFPQGPCRPHTFEEGSRPVWNFG